jgi:octaprenyl-diphosphate synthase
MSLGEDTLVNRVKAVLRKVFHEQIEVPLGITLDVEAAAGKMLRTRLAQCFTGALPLDQLPPVVAACVAVELIHTASLFHDDVIDGASIRRGKPALWRVLTSSSTILIGDILFCEALDIMLKTENNRLFSIFNDKVKEVCKTEVRQELSLRGTRGDQDTSVQIARGKTGPLFAFCAMVCAGKDRKLEQALEETGYRFGCAYQIADDILDESGLEQDAGKTLGTDRFRNKFTLAHADPVETHSIFLDVCRSIAEPLQSWPVYHECINQFVADVFQSPLKEMPRQSFAEVRS